MSPDASESMLGYHPCSTGLLTCSRDPAGGQCLVGSLTGAVASERVSEALKGSLRMVGNHSKSAKAEGSLTATPTGGAGTKVGLSDPMAFPLNTTGSLSPTFVPAPPVGVTVKLPSAFALSKWFPTILREPLSASDTLSEATAPVKLPAWHCPTAGLRRLVRNPIPQGWYANSGST